jgi:hypothetical protein
MACVESYGGYMGKRILRYGERLWESINGVSMEVK